MIKLSLDFFYVTFHFLRVTQYITFLTKKKKKKAKKRERDGDISVNDGSVKNFGFIDTLFFAKEVLEFLDLLQNALHNFKYSVSDLIVP